MTDPELADRTYVEPLTVEIVEKIIARERPDALLPTLGGQTALNLTTELAKAGVLDKYGVKLIGANLQAIEKAEDRELFKQAMQKIGLSVPLSGYARSLEEGHRIQKEIAAACGQGFPVILRPSFTMGGSGAAVAWNAEEFDSKLLWGLQQSPRGEVLVEQSVLGWKEYELEIMRDRNDNAVIVCSIENLDPMGIHTGDCITIAPAMTLTDKEYQVMRDAAIAVIREIGVETGGSNIQFAINPEDRPHDRHRDEPARVAQLGAGVEGHRLPHRQDRHQAGGRLHARRDPERHHPRDAGLLRADHRLRRHQGPALRLREVPRRRHHPGPADEVGGRGHGHRPHLQGVAGQGAALAGDWPLGLRPGASGTPPTLEELKRSISSAGPDRLWQLAEALRMGLPLEEAHQLTAIDPWFLTQLAQMVAEDESVRELGKAVLDDGAALARAKRLGMSDRRIMKLADVKEEDVRKARHKHGLRPVYKRVDTCAAEFESLTPYLYSTYEEGTVDEPLPDNEAKVTGKKKIIILGGGPNRIGQGIEFDYCCVHAVMALREAGYETIMVNCNPETCQHRLRHLATACTSSR